MRHLSRLLADVYSVAPTVLRTKLTIANACHSRTPTTSTYVQRISAEQVAIEERLATLGVENIRQMLSRANLDAVSAEDKMSIDQPEQRGEVAPQPIGAKQFALAKFVGLIHSPISISVLNTTHSPRGRRTAQALVMTTCLPLQKPRK